MTLAGSKSRSRFAKRSWDGKLLPESFAMSSATHLRRPAPFRICEPLGTNMKLASLTDLMISTASTGDWGNLPEEFQTEANLLLPDRHGWTAAHHAASEG